MVSVIVLVFALTYVGMALGRIPGLRIDRSGIAMVAAIVLVAMGAVPVEQIVTAIHFPTLHANAINIATEAGTMANSK
jgi:hypothetical protein